MVEKETLKYPKTGMTESECEAYNDGYIKGYIAGLEYYDTLTHKLREYLHNDMVALKEAQERV